MWKESTKLYFIYDDRGFLLYVGISLTLLSRLANHRSKYWFPDFGRIEWETYKTRAEALFYEEKAIKALKPPYNVVHNDSVERYGSPKSLGAILEQEMPESFFQHNQPRELCLAPSGIRGFVHGDYCRAKKGRKMESRQCFFHKRAASWYTNLADFKDQIRTKGYRWAIENAIWSQMHEELGQPTALTGQW